jgi:membrane protein required for colicin V production
VKDASFPDSTEQSQVEPATTLNRSMPITLLDIILLGVMLISGLLAMIRGFMREVLSIASWAVAAVATLYAYSRLLPYAKGYFNNNDIIATVVVVGGVFLATLLIVSIVTVRISDAVLDSRVGALDRTLGFLFGLGRGLLIVVVAFLFFVWLVPDRGQPDWVKSAKSRVVLQGTGQWLMSMLPDDPESTILKRLKRPKGDETDQPDAPDQRSGLGPAPGLRQPNGTDSAYGRSDRVGMRQLIESKTVSAH